MENLNFNCSLTNLNKLISVYQQNILIAVQCSPIFNYFNIVYYFHFYFKDNPCIILFLFFIVVPIVYSFCYVLTEQIAQSFVNLIKRIKVKDELVASLVIPGFIFLPNIMDVIDETNELLDQSIIISEFITEIFCFLSLGLFYLLRHQDTPIEIPMDTFRYSIYFLVSFLLFMNFSFFIDIQSYLFFSEKYIFLMIFILYHIGYYYLTRVKEIDFDDIEFKEDIQEDDNSVSDDEIMTIDDNLKLQTQKEDQDDLYEDTFFRTKKGEEEKQEAMLSRFHYFTTIPIKILSKLVICNLENPMMNNSFRNIVLVISSINFALFFEELFQGNQFIFWASLILCLIVLYTLEIYKIDQTKHEIILISVAIFCQLNIMKYTFLFLTDIFVFLGFNLELSMFNIKTSMSNIGYILMIVMIVSQIGRQYKIQKDKEIAYDEIAFMTLINMSIYNSVLLPFFNYYFGESTNNISSKIFSLDEDQSLQIFSPICSFQEMCLIFVSTGFVIFSILLTKFFISHNDGYLNKNLQIFQLILFGIFFLVTFTFTFIIQFKLMLNKHYQDPFGEKIEEILVKVKEKDLLINLLEDQIEKEIQDFEKDFEEF